LARLGEYFEYDDSSLYIWRSGDENDAFIDCVDTVKIVLNRGVLNEIPDPYTRVKAYILPKDHSFTEDQLSDPLFLDSEVSIIIMDEIDAKIYNAPKTPTENQYIVNYSNGIITFNPSLNARDVVCIYKGRGRILTPATRIWISSDNPYVVDNLQEFIDLATIKIEEIDRQIGLAQQATEYANQAGDYANDRGDYAQLQGNRVDYLIDINQILQIETKKARDFAIDAGYQALDAADIAIDARNRTILIWQSPVNNYDDLIATYPTPEIGWTVLLNESGVVYRFDGAQWKDIGNMTLSTPLATENIDGLMSKNNYVKLQEIESNAEVNFKGEDAKNVLPDYFKTKVICFIIPEEVVVGTQDIIINFPYEGSIVGITASLNVEGTDNTEIDIEKVAKSAFAEKQEWSSILNRRLSISYGDKVDDGEFSILEYSVNKDDYFRINVIRAGIGASSLTVLIEIQI